MSATAAKFTTLEMCAISRSATNPRLSMDLVALNGLCESIMSVGLQNPILVRPDADGYEIVAGHRRYAAFEMLGREEIPAIVRELTDDQCREAQLVDNLQRADLDPMEECKAYAALRERLGTPAAIAQRVGKTTAHVTRVLQLDNLTLFAKRALGLKLIGFDHALLLAKVGWAEQERALSYVLDPYAKKAAIEDLIERRVKEMREGPQYRGMPEYEPVPPSRLKQWIAHHVDLRLSKAPWPLDADNLVPAAGACTNCPKNTSANDALFGDLAIESATCTDAECFGEKREAFVELQLQVAQGAGKGAVRISWADADKKPKWLKDGSGPKLDQVFKAGQWIEAKASCEHAVQGVAVDYDRSYRRDEKKRPGVTLSVCVAAGCKRHPKAWEKAVTVKASGSAEAKAEAQEKQKADAEACRA